MRKCCIPKATTTIKIVIPLVTFFSLAKIQIIHSFANSLARAGWLDRSGVFFGRGGGGGVGEEITFTKIVSVPTDEDHYIFYLIFFFNFLIQ